jgi:hypothetical protein
MQIDRMFIELNFSICELPSLVSVTSVIVLLLKRTDIPDLKLATYDTILELSFAGRGDALALGSIKL